jgi:hypothetical protein
MDVGEHGVHLGLEGEPRGKDRVLIAEEGECPGRGAATEAADSERDFKVVIAVRLLHHVEVKFTGDNKRFILGGFAGILRRKRELRLLGGKQALFTGLEMSELRTEALKLGIRVGRFWWTIVKASELITEGLKFRVERSDRWPARGHGGGGTFAGH